MILLKYLKLITLKQFAISLLMSIIIGTSAAYYSVGLEIENRFKSDKPNILVLSFCSLRKSALGLYSADAHTPFMDKLFHKAFVFRNAYTKYSWTNLANYSALDIPLSFYQKQGYRLLEPTGDPFFMRIPPGWEDISNVNGNYYQINQFYKKGLDLIKERILNTKSRPFYLMTHFKYMHYPYIDSLNPNPQWDKYLTPEERSHVLEILNQSQNYPNKVPMQMLLSDNPDILRRHPQIRLKLKEGDFFNSFGFVAGLKYLLPWQQETDYEIDLNLIKKIYRAKVDYLDQNFKEIFNLFNDSDLIENTVVIVTGDHGEALMEHKLLGHAVHIYDEMISFPLIVRFPKSKLNDTVYIDQQFYQGSINNILVDMMQKKITEDNFLTNIESLKEKNEYIISRNCHNTVRSVRWLGKWKLIINEETSEKYLFHIEVDPQEKTNVYDQNPDIATQLEIYLLEHIDELEFIRKGPHKNERCLGKGI